MPVRWEEHSKIKRPFLQIVRCPLKLWYFLNVACTRKMFCIGFKDKVTSAGHRPVEINTGQASADVSNTDADWRPYDLLLH